MASPATAAFLLAWRRQSAKPALLVQIDLTEPTSRTIKLSNVSVATPDGSYWEPLIKDCEPIEAPGGFLSTGPDLCTTALVLFNKRLAYQTAGKVLANSFTEYRWEGATITFWFWEQTLTDFADKLQVFKGVISAYEPDQRTVRMPCMQRTDWNKNIAPNYVNRKKYPNAPEKSIGLPIPVLMGKGHARPMRGEWGGTIGANRDKFDRAGGAIPTVQGVIVDTGAGASGDKPKVVFASHALDSFADMAAGTNVFIKTESEHPAIWDTAHEFNAATDTGFTIPDAFDTAYYIMVPSDVDLPATPASEPRYATDVGNELTYALLDYDNSKRKLELPLVAASDPGEYVSARLVLGYKTVGGATGLRLSFFNKVSASGVDATITASTTPTTMYGTSIVGHEPANPWDFSQCEAQVNFNGGVGTGVKCHVYFVALEIRYKPRREFLRMAKRVEMRPVYFGANGRRAGWERKMNINIQSEQLVDYPVTEFKGEFFANANGQRDDGSGTYTGTANAVIERPHDILHYLLRTYLEQTSGQMNVSTGLHGDLVLLDTPLATHNNKNQVYFLKVDREMTGEEAITKIARDALMWVYISRFTDKWHMLGWVPGVGIAYDLTLEPKHVIGDDYLRVRMTPKNRILTGVRVRYLWDAFRQQHIGEVRVAHDGSEAGHHYDNLRDQYMSVVTGLNDKINFKRSAVAYTATLAAGDYNDATLLTELESKMNVPISPICVGIGCRIVTNVNDFMRFNDGSARTATLAAGLYATMGALATEVASKMNSVSSNWSCSFSLVTKKFTISRSAGTAQLSWGFRGDCAAALGFDVKAYTGLSSYTSDREVEQERFVIASDAALELNWETGADGLSGTRHDASELFGWSNLRDLTGAWGYTAPCPKNNREQKCLLAKTRYSARRTLPIDADMILDTDTARAIANRLVDLETEPRVLLEFETSYMPDLERGRVLPVSADFDAYHPYPKYGSNGSWAGKKLWVERVRQHAVRRWIQEVECIEAD